MPTLLSQAASQVIMVETSDIADDGKVGIISVFSVFYQAAWLSIQHSES